MKDDVRQKYKDFLLRAAYYATICFLVYFACKYALDLIAPFVIGAVFACLLKPAVDFMQRAWKFKRSIAALICVALFFCVIGLAIILSGVRIITEVQDFIANLPQIYSQQIAPAISSMFDWAERLVQRYRPEMQLSIDETARVFSQKLGEFVNQFSSVAISSTARFAGSIPALMVRVIFTILTTFYVASDYRNITSFILRQLPAKAANVVVRSKQQLGSTLSKYLRSYAIILGMTFVELCIGFSILRVENAGGWALFIAFFDILPVVGSSFVLVPWTIVSFIQGNISRTIGLAIITAIVWVVRNVMEPRIVGSQVGLHPLLTLIAMYVGTKLFGVIGLFGLPITLAIITALQKEGTVKVYK